MAGILNKKSRFIDLVITAEGKRQIASGGLKAEYASFSDMNTYYENSEKHEEARKRIYFEVMERPENVIVLEKDDSGKLIDFDFSPTKSIVGENIFSKNDKASDLHKLKLATGSQFASLSNEIPDAILTHFKANNFVGTFMSNENNEFELSATELNFSISNSVPFPLGPNKEIINVDQAEPFILDQKLTHLNNFQYLPPVNRNGTEYGKYSDLRNLNRETWEDIKQELGLKHFESIEDFKDGDYNLRTDNSGDFKVLNRKQRMPTSTEILKEFKVINFDKTSDENNLIMQFFENDFGRSKIKKLDIVDAGVFYEEEDINMRYEKRVFYVGKIYIDSFNTPTFINIFTIVMD